LIASHANLSNLGQCHEHCSINRDKQYQTATTPKLGTSQAKVNHVSLQNGYPTCLLNARLATEISEKLTFPSPDVYQEVNEIYYKIRDCSINSAQTKVVSDESRVGDRNNTASVSVCSAGMPITDFDPLKILKGVTLHTGAWLM